MTLFNRPDNWSYSGCLFKAPAFETGKDIGMMRTTILLILTTCSFGSLQAADVVVLTNGDRLTGTVQKLEKGKLVFKSKHSETPLQIDWTLVSGLTTELEIKVTRQDGTEETGRLLASSG